MQTYMLDTDHLSVLQRGGSGSQNLQQKLGSVDPTLVAASIVSYEEQIRGWFSYISKAQSIEQQTEAYKRLKKQLRGYCVIQVLEFDQQAAQEFQRLKKVCPRLGTMDLKIASIASANQAVLLTRNSTDFGQISGLIIEDWT